MTEEIIQKFKDLLIDYPEISSSQAFLNQIRAVIEIKSKYAEQDKLINTDRNIHFQRLVMKQYPPVYYPEFISSLLFVGSIRRDYKGESYSAMVFKKIVHLKIIITNTKIIERFYTVYFEFDPSEIRHKMKRETLIKRSIFTFDGKGALSFNDNHEVVDDNHEEYAMNYIDELEAKYSFDYNNLFIDLESNYIADIDQESEENNQMFLVTK